MMKHDRCDFCGKPFHPLGRKRRWCGQICRVEYMKREKNKKKFDLGLAKDVNNS